MKRSSGILLHITSLPSKFGIGDLGPASYDFVNKLKKSNQSYWQILPLTPTESICDYSPYSSPSAFAGNPLLISPELLIEDGYLKKSELPKDHFDDKVVLFDQVAAYKEKMLDSVFENHFQAISMQADYKKFVKNSKYWLEDYALFRALKLHNNQRHWKEWSKEIRNYESYAIEQSMNDLVVDIDRVKCEQFIFQQQWRQLKAYANNQNIKIIGDIPIYVDYDSVDIWAHRSIFKCKEDGALSVVAGVPPDYFSKTGQRWGNPVYDWKYLTDTKFDWWINRIKHNLGLYDVLRIDHFRAFVNYWEIPSKEKTAKKGKWVDVPSKKFFDTLKKLLPRAHIIAEDLGMIDDDVRVKIDALGFPGMKVLMFAFGSGNENMYLPENISSNSVMYTGTHDNNTVCGWFKNDATKREINHCKDYFKKRILAKDVHLDFVKMAAFSRADLALFPVQDILGLGKEARMNQPGTGQGNWRWRMGKNDLSSKHINALRKITVESSRIHF